MKISIKLTFILIVMFSLLVGCKSENQAKKYWSIEELTQAIFVEAEQIKQLEIELSRVKTFDEKKDIGCNKVAEKYETIEHLMKANEHLIKNSEKDTMIHFVDSIIAKKDEFKNQYCEN